MENQGLLFEPRPPTRVRRWPLWPFVLFGLMTALTAGVFLAAQVSVPYYTFSPGPVFEIDEFLEIEDGVPLNGDFYMLTVSLQEATALEYALALVDPAVDLVPRESVRPAGVTPDQYRQRNRTAMDQSKKTAIFLALNYLGYEVTLAGDGVEVAAVLEDTPAFGVLEEGDVIVEVDGVAVFLRDDGVNRIRAHEIGETVGLTVVRGDERFSAEIILVEHTQDLGAPMVGFVATTYNWRYEASVAVYIDTQNVGGPSAGLMYTLGIIDQLNDIDLLDGHQVAGTGTVSSDGTVGPIGGIKQKIIAAADAGAEYMLVPTRNFEEAIELDRQDLELVEIGTLQDALEFLASL